MWSSSFGASALVGALVAAVSALPPPQQRSTACNNSPSLCDRKYNEITHLGAHDSYALRDSSTDDSAFGNQYLNATLALEAGLRLLQVQTHEGNATLELCHSSCTYLDAGPFEDFLVEVNTWMDDNPNDVVTVVAVNSDSAPASEFNEVLESSGLSKKAYTSTSSTPTGDWPTLQKMIDDDKRFVLFVTGVDYASDTPAVLPEFDFVFETAFEVTSLSGFNCTLDRPSKIGDASSAISSNYLSLVNHFKYESLADSIQLPDIDSIQLPDVDTIGTVNSASTSDQGNLGLHLQQCNDEWKTVPNFVLIDFWNEANPLNAVDRMNKVEDATGRTKAKSGAPDNAAGRVGAGAMEYGAIVAAFSAVMLLV